MRCRRLVVATVVAVGGLALAGCDSTATGTPTPQSGASDTSSQESSSTESDRLAPPVQNPKDLRGIDPCQLLTPQQLTELTFVEPGKTDSTPWGEQKCNWQNSNLVIGLSPDTRREGLEETYRRENNFDNFEVSSVGDYPAVRVDFASQGCGVIVGVADDQTVTVHFGRVTGKDPAYEDPCGFAESVAAMVLENLPAG
jgi:hypothetical protein